MHAQAQTPLRVAVLDLLGDEKGALAGALRALARGRLGSEFELVDEDLARAAARGFGYRVGAQGSLNMHRDEARALGQSLGCDFYLLGKAQTARRLGQADQFYQEALLGLFIVETRTGGLAAFAFERAQAATKPEARQALLTALGERWASYAQSMREANARRQAEVESVGREAGELIEVLNDDELGKDGALPVFYQRLKPEYTKEAELAGIIGTVELEAVFQADGKVGDVQVVRWAGYGLDEAALAAVRKLRFKPARRAEKEVTLRGLVRYNFRRPPTMAEKQEEAERLKRSLRIILGAGQKPGSSPVKQSPPPRPEP